MIRSESVGKAPARSGLSASATSGCGQALGASDSRSWILRMSSVSSAGVDTGSRPIASSGAGPHGSRSANHTSEGASPSGVDTIIGGIRLPPKPKLSL